LGGQWGNTVVRMQEKVLAFSAFGLGSGLLIGVLTLRGGATFWILPIVLWYGALALLGHFILRCPHCRELSIYRGGLSTPFVGRRCEKCGKEY
jgi:hypothetical protein